MRRFVDGRIKKLMFRFIKVNFDKASLNISRSSFIKTKVLIWTYFLIWLGLLGFLIANWSELSPFVKFPLALVEGVFAPESGIFRALFESFPKFESRIKGRL